MLKVYFSIISHKQSLLAYSLVETLLSYRSIKVHYIENDPHSPLIELDHENLVKHHNDIIKGFGENHNFAFSHLNLNDNDVFVICNPDISFKNNEIKNFLAICSNLQNELSTTVIKDSFGNFQDNVRSKLNLFNLLSRYLFRANPNISENNFWFAGMFLFCRSDVFKKLNGFDESFFLYCEDADICYRARSLSIKLNVYKEISFIHNARRDSKRKPKYFYLHVKSLIKLWYKHGLFH